jgi:CheY-like chemotaxis protein
MDLIMPQMNVKTVYDEIRKMQPDIKALFTSDYPLDVIHSRGIFERDLIFATKPIVSKEFLKEMRETWSAGLRADARALDDIICRVDLAARAVLFPYF